MEAVDAPSQGLSWPAIQVRQSCKYCYISCFSGHWSTVLGMCSAYSQVYWVNRHSSYLQQPLCHRSDDGSWECGQIPCRLQWLRYLPHMQWGFPLGGNSQGCSYVWVRDSGSVLMLVNNEGPTDRVLYSMDEGLSWKEYLIGQSIQAASIITMTEETSRKFILFGHTSSGTLVAIHLDFSAIMSRQCMHLLVDVNATRMLIFCS